MIIKTYSELCQLETYEERFDYLSLGGRVGEDTFGFDRYLNQQLYKSREWKMIRDMVIVRDNGCDLGLEGYDIFGTIYVHHINPLKPEDIINSTEYLFNPDYLVCMSLDTHNAIHYGQRVDNQIITRTKNDHCPWKK